VVKRKNEGSRRIQTLRGKREEEVLRKMIEPEEIYSQDQLPLLIR
jgi:hypothetical protein